MNVARVRFGRGVGRWLRLGVKLLLATVCTSGSASAQSLTLSPVIIRREGRPSELPSNVINYDDCAAEPSGDTLTALVVELRIELGTRSMDRNVERVRQSVSLAGDRAEPVLASRACRADSEHAQPECA